MILCAIGPAGETILIIIFQEKNYHINYIIILFAGVGYLFAFFATMVATCAPIVINVATMIAEVAKVAIIVATHFNSKIPKNMSIKLYYNLFCRG